MGASRDKNGLGNLKDIFERSATCGLILRGLNSNSNFHTAPNIVEARFLILAQDPCKMDPKFTGFWV
jgi:hypothetical protein